jgi:hypothetical protein
MTSPVISDSKILAEVAKALGLKMVNMPDGGYNSPGDVYPTGKKASNEWNRFLRFRHTPPITSDDAKEKLLFVENKRSRMMQQMMGRIVLYVEGNINYARGFQTPEELVEYLQGGTLLKDIEEADNSSSDEEDEY